MNANTTMISEDEAHMMMGQQQEETLILKARWSLRRDPLLSEKVRLLQTPVSYEDIVSTETGDTQLAAIALLTATPEDLAVLRLAAKLGGI